MKKYNMNLDNITGVVLSEYIHPNINAVLTDVFDNEPYAYYKHLKSSVNWTSNPKRIHDVSCKYVIVIGHVQNTEELLNYRGRPLLHMEGNAFLWNDSFHPEVRVYYLTSEEGKYLDIMKFILKHGSVRIDRTKVGTRSIFGKTLEFGLQDNRLPLLTSKKVFFKGVLHELLWFLRGSTTTKQLHQNGVKIWDGNSTRDFLDRRGLSSYKEGELGPIYGYQWRKWGAEYKNKTGSNGIDQINHIITTLKLGDHTNRRMILSAWNVSDLQKMVLPPCHCFCQFYVSDYGLCCALTQRSADVFLGLPFNIASYATLTHMIAHVTGLRTDKLVIHLGDTHIYNNHIEQCEQQLSQSLFDFPKLKITRTTANIDDLVYEDFVLDGYKSNPSIPAPMAV